MWLFLYFRELCVVAEAANRCLMEICDMSSVWIFIALLYLQHLQHSPLLVFQLTVFLTVIIKFAQQQTGQRFNNAEKLRSDIKGGGSEVLALHLSLIQGHTNILRKVSDVVLVSASQCFTVLHSLLALFRKVAKGIFYFCKWHRSQLCEGQLTF